MRRASSATTAWCDGVAAARGIEDVARLVRRHECRRLAASCELPRVGRDGSGARVELLAEPDPEVVELAGGAVMAAMELAAEHDAGTEAGPDRDEGKVVDAASDATLALTECRKVDVVLEGQRQLESRGEVGGECRSLEPGHICREPDVASLHCTGNPEDDAVDRLPGHAGRAEQRADETRDLQERRCRGLLSELDVLARPDVALQVGERAADETGAEVDAHDVSRLGYRREERRAVSWPASVRLRLAHEPRLEQRLERKRHGRLRDPDPPRDLGTRDRRGCADRLEHRPLVHVLQERRCGAN